MGVNTDLEFDKFCKVGRVPRNVLPAPRHKSTSNSRSRKVKHSSKDCHKLLNSEEEFAEIKFRNYRSISCKNLPSSQPSRDVESECNEAVRRGSVCCSGETKFRPETRSGRKKIEVSCRGNSPFSFSILDSICGSDEEVEAEPEQKRSSKTALNSEAFFSAKPPRQPCTVDFRGRQIGCGRSAEIDSMENRKSQCQEVNGPLNTGNVPKERDLLALNKSLSVKGSPKSRFAPFRKMFDPLVKSKSYRNPPSDAKLSGLTDTRAMTLRNSMSRLSRGFSSSVSNVELPARLQGNLKMERKHEVPYFEFSMAGSEEVFVAKTWKTEDALNWVYTFHSTQARKKSNTTVQRVKYRNKDSPMVGQMQVKSFLCAELKSGGTFDDSVKTEFVLYEIGHARKSDTSNEGINSRDFSNISCASPYSEVSGEGNVELDDLFAVTKPSMPMTSAFDRMSTDFSSPYPLSPADLHPIHEIAAVVVQVPLGKRGDDFGNQVHAVLERAKNTLADNKVKVNVVTPSGYHTLPNCGDIKGPSSLLDRWRSGGGCDCGGWDVDCPLVIFDIPTTQCSKESSLLEKTRPLKFYVQGGKENVSALTITATQIGQYTVDFHPQLSPLQAFGVCVAILHASKASNLGEHEISKKLIQCNSLKAMEKNAPVFVPNPLFSPIARV